MVLAGARQSHSTLRAGSGRTRWLGIRPRRSPLIQYALACESEWSRRRVMSISVLVGCRARRGHGAVVAAIAAAETANWTRSGDVLNRGLALASVNDEEMAFLL